ncbi:MAG: hypothetical protein KBS81_02525, partial [Spirochaetales bacterium]|nr:hypothetical protein [Candidatus Physcosoma equi]
MRKTLLALLFLFVAILEIGALTPTLTYYGILDKGKEISIPLAWKTQSLEDSSSDYDDTLA